MGGPPRGYSSRALQRANAEASDKVGIVEWRNLLSGKENGVVEGEAGFLTSPVRESVGMTQRRRGKASDEGVSTPVLYGMSSHETALSVQ